MSEIGEFVLPGFGAFAATRFLTRTATTQIESRKPTWGKHAGALASVGSFLAAWLLAHRVKWLAKYQTPLVVGSALAALQSLIQLYVPQLGWVVSDASPELAAGSDATSAAVAASTLPAGMTVVDDDPNLYVYDNQYDGGRYAQPASGKPNPSATAQASNDQYNDLAVDDANQSAQNMGIFSPN